MGNRSHFFLKFIQGRPDRSEQIPSIYSATQWWESEMTQIVLEKSRKTPRGEYPEFSFRGIGKRFAAQTGKRCVLPTLPTNGLPKGTECPATDSWCRFPNRLSCGNHRIFGLAAGPAGRGNCVELDRCRRVRTAKRRPANRPCGRPTALARQ